ncbi:hypothetical protein [Pararhizobium sp.]|uniref:hypothetical protein n=1 Tax=Pararhizobium sp. TaxID=1977563 RepID=UPI00272281B4|nr:hypothetical protein [Pararhizobium sp.]MDO9416218.1 hypothetical protein [Pararhizobium sp.]
MAQELPPTTTLRHLWEGGKLKYANNFVRLALRNMEKIEKSVGPCLIRVGLLGRGETPNYQVLPMTDGTKSLPSSLSTKAVHSDEEKIAMQYFILRARAFNGRSKEHKMLDTPMDGSNWATSGMSLASLRQLLGDIRESEKALRSQR